jgi:PAS domain S-box-containing protein
MMSEEKKTKEQLIEELKELRNRLSELEAAEAEHRQPEEELNSEREQLLSLFESINEIIYVADPETYEILYANKFLKEAFGKDLEGGTCYRELQGLDEPCDFCTNKIILKQKGKPYTWEYHNPVLDRHYMITDRIIKWPDGRDVRFELAIDITERKEAEEALQSEKAFTEVALNSLADVFYVLDAEGSLLRWNDSFSRVTGHSDEELSSMSVLDFFGGEDLQRQREFFRTLLREGQASFEAEVMAKDGRRIPYYFHSTLLRDAEGNPDIVCGVGRDINERKRAEEALRESEEKYRDLFESASDLIQSVTPQGRFVYVNRAWKETLGYDEEEVKDLNMFDIIHPESMEHCMETFGRVVSGEDVEGIEASFVSKDGRKIMVEGSASCRFVDGKPANTRGIFHDVTERKQSEEELRRLSNAVKMSTDSIVLADTEGKITEVNEATVEMYGAEDKNNLIGRNAFDLIAAEDRERALAGMAEAMEKGYVESREYQVVRQDGTHIPVEMSVATMKDAKDELIGFVAVSRDISERNRVEEALRESAHNLAERIKELDCLYSISRIVEKPGISLEEIMQETVDILPASLQYPEVACARIILHEREFKTANFEKTAWEQSSELMVRGQRVGTVEVDYLEVRPEEDEGPFLSEERNLVNAVAEELGRIIDRKLAEEEKQLHMQELESFAQSISHDLRGPLALIIGFSHTARMARERGNEELELQSMDDALRAARRMDDFIDSLLQYTRAGRPQEKAVRVEPGEVLREVLLDMEGIIQDKGAEVEVEGDLPAIKVNAAKLKQVLSNLLGNAIKFTWENIGPQVEVGAKKEDDTVTIYIHDNGLGIPEEKRQAIFEPFKRYSSVEYPGLGIGLSTVKRAVEAWGGKVWVESIPGKGSTFYFTAPAAD